MKFWEYFDGEDVRVFATKTEAIKEARAHAKWLTQEAKDSDSPDNRDPVSVDEIDIGALNRTKALALIRGEGYVEGRAEVVRQTRSLLFTNIYLTVGEEKFLRASQIAKIPSGEGQAFGKAKLDRSGATPAAATPR